MKMNITSGTKRKKKILFFIPGLSEGGAEKVLRNLVNNMDQTKFDITVQTIDRYDPKQYLVSGIHYKAVNHCKTKIGKKIFSYWFRLCAELKLAYYFYVKDDYDIEIAYLETIATKIIAQSTNKKAVKLAWVHCDLSKKEEMKHSLGIIRKQYSKYDRIICVSQDVETAFHKLLGKDLKTDVLYNVIDNDEIIRKAAEQLNWKKRPCQKKLLAIGRLTQQKNFVYLIETCGYLRDAGYQFHLNILGEGPEKSSLNEAIEKLKMENYITLRGFVQNPYPWIEKSDLIVCSSIYEGFSTVVQEALILRKVVVTTPCTGMKELLGESEYGLIVDDSEEGLYNGLKKLMDEPELEKKYLMAAEKRGKQFSKEQTVRLIEKYFENF